eukprot:2278087-Rhodomonas_salina.2
MSGAVLGFGPMRYAACGTEVCGTEVLYRGTAVYGTELCCGGTRRGFHAMGLYVGGPRRAARSSPYQPTRSILLLWCTGRLRTSLRVAS